MNSSNEVCIYYVTGHVYIMRGEECVMMFKPDKVSVRFMDIPNVRISNVNRNNEYGCYELEMEFT